MDFPLDDWINRPRDPETLSRFTVDYNRWDRKSFQRMMTELREFQAKRQKLIDTIAGDVGYDVWQDLWLALWKVNPEMFPEGDVRPSHIINHMVMKEAQDLQDYLELHQHTNGDEIGASLACITMEPEIETLYDRMHEAQKLADELDDLLKQLAAASQQQQDIEQLWEEWTQDNDPEDPQNGEAKEQHDQAAGDIQQEIDALKQQMQQQGQELQEELEGSRPDIRQSLRAMIQSANENAAEEAMASQMWGKERGWLQRLSAKERLELAKKVAGGKIREIAKLFGKIKPFAMRMQSQKIDYLREETFDIEFGNDTASILAYKFAQLDDPDEEDFFYADFLGKRLPQYKMRGVERLHQGGVILLYDGSGSMSGPKEHWTKAIGIVLLQICKKERRSFYGIQFSYSKEDLIVHDFRDTRNITPEQVVDFAEQFLGGGTDFMCPINEAVEILEEEHRKFGAVKSDIVIITDGQASIDQNWLKELKKTQDKLKIRIWGAIIGGDPKSEPLNSICDGKVFTVKDLTTGGDIAHIFKSI